MNMRYNDGLHYTRGLEKVLFPHRYKKIFMSILAGITLSGSLGPNTEKDHLCEIGQRYSKTEGRVLKILDCKTGVTISTHDISNLLLNPPIK